MVHHFKRSYRKNASHEPIQTARKLPLHSMKTGVLLIQLGTPAACNQSAVCHYLKDFLSDPRVIDLPAVARYALLYGVILPFRTPRTTRAYAQIWTKSGSPLRIHSQALQQALAKVMGNDYKIELGMRYGEPCIQTALNRLGDCEHIIVLPLYPQYASSSTGSSLSEALRCLSRQSVIPSLTFLSTFYNHPAFIQAYATLIQSHLPAQFDCILFSYHGLPQRHIQKSGCKHLCQQACTQQNTFCYRAQCYATSRALAQALDLPESSYHVSFQSRLGRTPWIQPYTDNMLKHLAQQGVKHLVVACPSFVADCLETLEEIGIRARSQWRQQLHQGSLTLIPCLNATPVWVNALKTIICHNR